MKNNAKLAFSIIIPTLNEEKYLPNLLKDLEKQTLKDFEVIIVDAKSDDDTVKKAKRFKGRFKNFTILESNKRNVSRQRNIGANKAKSDWHIFMDADNQIPPYFLTGIKFQIEMENPDILSCWIEPDTNNKKDKLIANVINIFIDIVKTSKNPAVLGAMICIRKPIFNRLKGFNERLHWGEDGDLLRRANKTRVKFSFAKNPKYKYSFRRFRKQGTFNLLYNIAQNELARLEKKVLPKQKVAKLYPLEGGKFYELGKKDSLRIRNLLMKLIKDKILKE